MPSLYELKPRFQSLLRPAAKGLARAGAKPNHVTIAAAVLSFAAGGAILCRPTSVWPLVAMPAVLLARMALDAVDGMVAREHGGASPLGAMLNELGDLVADCALYLPLALVPGVPAPLAVTAVALGLVAEASALAAREIGSPRRHEGPMGKSDRALAFGAIACALGATSSRVWVAPALAAVAILSVATIANRVRAALAAARA